MVSPGCCGEVGLMWFGIADVVRRDCCAEAGLMW